MQELYPFNIRPLTSPSIKLPLACRSVGHYRVKRHWSDRVKKKNFCELFWGVRGTGIFLIDEQEVLLQPEGIILMYEGETHKITAATDWEYRWVTFDGIMPVQVLSALGMQRLRQGAGACPNELFERLSHEVMDVTASGQRLAGITLYELLVFAAGVREKDDRAGELTGRCLEYIREHYQDPEVNINRMARELEVNRTTLSKSFQEKIGISPIQYLQSVRVTNALKLLQNSKLPVAEIARLCGFSYTSYFTNVIRRYTGLSPRSIRIKS